MARWERTVLIRAPPAEQVDDVVVGPERDGDPGPVRSQPELLARHGTCSPTGARPGRTRPPPGSAPSAGNAERRFGLGRLGGGVGAAVRAAGSRRGNASRSAAGTGANRSAGEAMSKDRWGGGCCSRRPPSHRGRPARPRGRRTASWSASRSRRRVWWNRSILPVVVGARGLGEAVHDAVVPADPIEEHLAAPPEPGGELFAVVREDLVGDAVALQRPGEGQAHGPARGPHADRGDHAEPGVVIDPGDDLDLGSVGQEHAAHDVELPQRHRGVAFPPLVVLPPAAPRLGPRPGRDGPGSDTPSMPRAPATIPTRPSSCARRRGPQRGCSRRNSHTAASTSAGDWCGHELGPMRPVDQPAQTLVPIAGQPGVHGLAGHPDLGGHRHNRLSGQHGQHRPIALLDNGQLHQHRSRPPAARRPQTTYSQQADHGHCQPSGETDVSCINRSRTRLDCSSAESASTGSRAPAEPAPGGRRFRRPRPPAPAGGDGRPVVYDTLASRLGAPSSSGRRGLTSFRYESRRSQPFRVFISDRSMQQLLMRVPRSRADRSHLGRKVGRCSTPAKVSAVL